MAIKDDLDNYRQTYLNAKANNQLPSRIFLNQPTNKGDRLRLGKGRFGAGVYASGQNVNPNSESLPIKWQHAVSPDLILEADDFQNKFNGDSSAADTEGYVGVKFDEDDKGKASYFLFPDAVPLKEDGKDNESNISVFKHPITGVESKLIKDGVRWSVEGLSKTFRSKEKAEKYLQRDIDFLNPNGGN